MAYSQAWLEDTTATRCVLVRVGVYDVVGTTETFKFLSSKKYITETGDVVFDPIIAGGLTFSESLPIDGGVSVSYGNLEIHNASGDYDDWLDDTKYIWVNRTIQIYYGDPSWVTTNIAQVYTDFKLIFDGVIDNIDSSSPNFLTIKVRDKMDRLNGPITENKLGTYGTWASGQTNQDAIKPLVFGEVHNYEPLLIDPSTLEYMFNDGPAERLIEIRDNGVPIYTDPGLTSGATVNLTTGTFKLTSPLVGTCTVSAQGVKKSVNISTGADQSTYINNIANLIAMITKTYGNTYDKLITTDIDFTNLSTFSAGNTAGVGLLVLERENLLAACQELAASLGAQIFFTREGKLQILRIGSPTADPSVDITTSDYYVNTLYIARRTNIVAATKLGYCKNWAVQDNLLTNIPDAHKDMFSKEWLTVTATDGGTVKSLYKLNEDPVQKDTLLINTTEATSEATRLNNYYKSIHTVYGLTGTSKLLSLKLGQPVVLYGNRFGLSAGKTGQVVALNPDWSKGKIGVEVIV